MKRPPIFPTPKRIVLPGTTQTIKTVGGNFYYVLRASHAQFSLKINEGDWTESGLSEGHVFPPDFLIEQIEVWNKDTTLNLEIVIVSGAGTPLDNKLNLYRDEVIPSLRDETPTVISEAVSLSAVAGLGAWVKLLDADPLRAECYLSTTATTAAYWAPSNAGWAIGQSRNLVTTGGLSGQTPIRNKSEIWVWHTEAATEIAAVVHKFA